MNEHRDSHASSSHEVSLQPTFKRREDLGKHSVYTHFPKDRNCEICQRTKITRAPCRRRNGGAVPRADNFGDLITADDKVLIENCESRNNHRYRTWPPNGSSRIRVKQKLRRKHKGACKSSWSQIGNQESFYTDNSLVAERAVRRVMEGTSAILLQSGLDEKWWADSMECYCDLRNVTDLLSDGKTPCERRFGQPFKGPMNQFGSKVEYYPKTAKDQSRIHQIGKKVLPGLFLGYSLYAG